MNGGVYSACGEMNETVPIIPLAQPSHARETWSPTRRRTSSGSGTKKRTKMFSGGKSETTGDPAASVSLEGWSHVTMSVKNGVSGASESITVGGVVVDANYNLGPGFFVGDATAAVGWYYTQAPGERAALVDNVVLVVIE